VPHPKFFLRKLAFFVLKARFSGILFT